MSLRARSSSSPGAGYLPRPQRPPTGKSLSGVRFIAFVVGKKKKKKKQGMNARKMGPIPADGIPFG